MELKTTNPDLGNRCDVVPGLSDHALGGIVSIAGVTLGVGAIKRLVILIRVALGPDGGFLLDPEDLEQLSTANYDT